MGLPPAKNLKWKSLISAMYCRAGHDHGHGRAAATRKIYNNLKMQSIISFAAAAKVAEGVPASMDQR
jgi:hypothetical protein